MAEVPDWGGCDCFLPHPNWSSFSAAPGTGGRRTRKGRLQTSCCLFLVGHVWPGVSILDTQLQVCSVFPATSCTRGRAPAPGHPALGHLAPTHPAPGLPLAFPQFLGKKTFLGGIPAWTTVLGGSWYLGPGGAVEAPSTPSLAQGRRREGSPWPTGIRSAHKQAQVARGVETAAVFCIGNGQGQRPHVLQGLGRGHWTPRRPSALRCP
ncbi:uncharacterized protein LOC119941873 isoform X2 [Tachyglossus aculeatus]|uniref:uncharacterized protein LOC119941873 isoform X2 n=1 Tax=Tachyglossus aculeatus TaxID=9261 RepID=UPI0018F6909E|nr:uncharacterized protein LOC119941873 isoform X2 [Tachyglossus aculeatus]